MQSKIICVIFFLSWLLCGCAIDAVMDDWRSSVIVVIAVIVCIVTAAVITSGDK